MTKGPGDEVSLIRYNVFTVQEHLHSSRTKPVFRCTTGYSAPFKGVVAQCCNPQTLQSEQSDGMGSIPGRAPPLERHGKGSQTR